MWLNNKYIKDKYKFKFKFRLFKFFQILYLIKNKYININL